MLGQDIRILNSRYHSKAFFKELWETIQQGEVWQADIKNKDKDGSCYWVHIVIVPIVGTNGKPYEYISLSNDIKQRKYLEEKLKLSSTVLNHMTDGVYSIDVYGSIKSINHAFTTHLEYNIDEVINKNSSILHVRRHDKLWEEVCEKGSWQGEIWFQRKNKDIFLSWVTAYSVQNDVGEITNYIVVFRDITEREQLRKEVMLAGEIQKKMLPSELSNENIQMKIIYNPNQYISGDFYEYIWDNQNLKLSGFLIDIMGHGVATAFQYSALRVLLLQVANKNIPMDEKMYWLNNEALQFFSEDTFAAVICFEIALKERKITYSSGGIASFYIQSRHKTERVQTPGMFLGLLPDERYNIYERSFEIGDIFVFLSDGLLEMLDDKPFQSVGNDMEALYDKLHQTAFSGKNIDDATAVVIQIKA